MYREVIVKENEELKDLCLELAMAETEKEVIRILEDAGYWNNPNVWRYYGDNENNFSVIGNQQGKPEQALVEKIINSVDAVLMRECLRRKINPQSKDAPQNINDALHKFFGIIDGKLTNLTTIKRAKLAENIILVATGTKSNPCYSIIDKGEGQSPKRMPETFLSLTRANKLRIPFVQGKFNQGGTGALQFCGRHNLQLIISKRDPQISRLEKDETNDFWGFTIVRRERPREGMKNSVFKYLAPEGKILMFKAESLPLLPREYPNAYGNPLEWGSFVKLYEYQIGGLRTLVVFDLYNRLSLLMPNIALPVRILERRKGYSGHTLETTLSGLSVRLDEDKRENLEAGFPSSSNMRVMGQEMKILIYAFKKGKREKYSKNEGIIFTENGQAHGFLSKTFFERKSVGMSYLADSILVIVDCTDFDPVPREDLFMTSRDRLRHSKLRARIEEELEELIKKHPGLREIREKRRREELESKIGDSKPLLETVEKIIRRSPTLSKLLVEGAKLTNPFDLRGTKEGTHFKGKKFPSFFRLKEDYPKDKPKCCPINRRFRVQFETDAENEYFTRDHYPGEFSLYSNGDLIKDFSLNLWNGIANLTVRLPEGIKVDDIIYFECEVEDIEHTEPFNNNFYVKVEEAQAKISGKPGERSKPPGGEDGKNRKRSSSLDLPNIREVRKKDWAKYGFTKEDALIVKHAGEEFGYDFYINMDSVHLQTEIKGRTKEDPKLLEAQYKYGMVLIGLSLLKSFENNHEKNTEKRENTEEEGNVYQKIRIVARAVSPFLLPMISSLGKLEVES